MSTERPAPAGRMPVSTPRLVLGLCVLTAGVLLTLDNLDLVETDALLRLWPAGLIAVGVANVAHARGGNRRGGGILLILVGGWLLLNTLDIIDASVLELFWPMVLIVAGTSLILQSMRRRQHSASDANDVISSFAVMGGVKRTSAAARFRHAELTSLMGGCDLDLSQATIPPGERATIEVLAFMGRHTIRVPEGWAVDLRVFPFMGGVEDRTKPSTDASAPHLVVCGRLVMGGLHIEH